MKGTIFIEVDNTLKEPQLDFDNGLGGNTYFITVILPNINYPFEKVVNDKKKIKEVLDTFLDVFKCLGEETSFFNEFIKEVIDGQIDIFTNAQFIKFSNEADMNLFMKNNPEYKEKIVIFPDVVEMDETLKYYEKYKGKFKDIYFNIVGNFEPISVKDVIETKMIIDKLVYQIKSLNFSPFEEMMYVYDFVRDKVYQEEDKVSEASNISRDLSKALLGNKIVCVGYATIYEKLLQELGFKVRVVNFDGVKENSDGHTRNLVYVNDEKYGINGMYYVDPTWGSKRKNNEFSYLYSYKYFAKTEEEMEEFDKKELQPYYLPVFREEYIEDFEEVMKEKGIKGVSKRVIQSINGITRFMGLGNLIDPDYALPFDTGCTSLVDVNKIVSILKEYGSYCDKRISADIFLEALWNVRKKEYYLNPEKYPFDINNYFSIYVNSLWQFSKTPKDLIIEELFPELEERLRRDKARKYIIDEEIEKKMSQIKLTKTLSKITEKVK